MVLMNTWNILNANNLQIIVKEKKDMHESITVLYL